VTLQLCDQYIPNIVLHRRTHRHITGLMSLISPNTALPVLQTPKPSGTLPDEVVEHIIYFTLPCPSPPTDSREVLLEYRDSDARTRRRHLPERCVILQLSSVCQAWRRLAAAALRVHLDELRTVQNRVDKSYIISKSAEDGRRNLEYLQWQLQYRRINFVIWLRRKLMSGPGAPRKYCHRTKSAHAKEEEERRLEARIKALGV
jgi:hypothetical protein